MAVSVGQGVFSADDARGRDRRVDVEYDGSEGLGLWFSVDTGTDYVSVALSISHTEEFLRWVRDSFEVRD